MDKETLERLKHMAKGIDAGVNQKNLIALIEAESRIEAAFIIQKGLIFVADAIDSK